jgi:hypothetical protein
LAAATRGGGAALTAALETAQLEEQVRRTHLATIVALSKSMEARTSTGGHTERVAAVALALARQLGFIGEELEAIEIEPSSTTSARSESRSASSRSQAPSTRTSGRS